MIYEDPFGEQIDILPYDDAIIKVTAKLLTLLSFLKLNERKWTIPLTVTRLVRKVHAESEGCHNWYILNVNFFAILKNLSLSTFVKRMTYHCIISGPLDNGAAKKCVLLTHKPILSSCRDEIEGVTFSSFLTSLFFARFGSDFSLLWRNDWW